MKLEVYDSDALYTPDHEHYGKRFNRRFSSSLTYDMHLSAIFPHFVLVSAKQAATITEVLGKGYHFGYNASTGKDMYGPTSFASVLNDKDNGYNRDRVVWLSRASLATLQQHPDTFELTIHNSQVFPVMTPNEEVDNEDSN